MAGQKARLTKELRMLETDPPPGVSAWPKGDAMTELEAVIEGPEGSPYEGGHFRLDLVLSARYPFEPPKVSFVTRVYHPNVDEGGRICLDILNMPPKGGWKPSINVSTVLTSLRLLLSEPNADDPLDDDIASQLKSDPDAFRRAAAAHTRAHARPGAAADAAAAPDAPAVAASAGPDLTAAGPRAERPGATAPSGDCAGGGDGGDGADAVGGASSKRARVE